MNRTRGRLGRIVAVLATVIAGISGAVAVEPIRIGVSLGLTGQYEQPALMQRRAYELWRDDVNAKGGILGRPVELVIRNDRSDGATAKDIYNGFVAGNSVDHVFAPYSSQLTMAVAPIVDAAGFPMLAPGAANDEIWQNGYRNIFGLLSPASRYTQGMLRLAHEAGLTSIAIIHTDDGFAEEIAEGTRKWAPFLKLRIAVDVGVAKSKADLGDSILQAREAGVDLLMVAGYLDEAVHARRALADLAWSPRAFFATIGPALPEWKAVLGSTADLTFATSFWEPIDSFAYPRSLEFASAFKARYGTDPSYEAASAYAAGQSLEAAIGNARSVDHAAVRAALYDLDTYTVLGRFAVDRTGMQVKRLDVVVQWQNGRKEIVWPNEIRTSSPIFGRAMR